jgi:hypothetical protein
VATANRNLRFGTGPAQYFLPLWLQQDFGNSTLRQHCGGRPQPLWLQQAFGKSTLYGGAGSRINPTAGNGSYRCFGVARGAR